MDVFYSYLNGAYINGVFMEKIPMQKYLQLHTYEKFKFKILIYLTIAAFINSIGVGLLLVPANLFDGGNSGLSYLLNHLTGINISIYILVLNVPFYLAAYKVIGKNAVLYSLFSITMYSFSMFLLRDILKLHDLSMIKEITDLENDHLMLAAIFGGLLSGIGSGLTIRSGSSLDGTEIVAIILTKRIGVSVGKIDMTLNILMFAIIGLIMSTFIIPLYSIIAYVVGIKMVDSIVEGFDKAVSAIIITVKGVELAKVISKKMKRGITILEGKGYYSDTQKNVLYCVVNRFEVAGLKKLIFKTDANAFIAFSDVSDVMGTPVKWHMNIFKKRKNISDENPK